MRYLEIAALVAVTGAAAAAQQPPAPPPLEESGEPADPRAADQPRAVDDLVILLGLRPDQRNAAQDYLSATRPGPPPGSDGFRGPGRDRGRDRDNPYREDRARARAEATRTFEAGLDDLQRRVFAALRRLDPRRFGDGTEFGDFGRGGGRYGADRSLGPDGRGFGARRDAPPEVLPPEDGPEGQDAPDDAGEASALPPA